MITIYLDQSIYSKMLSEQMSEDGESGFAQVLQDFQGSGKAEVWLSPTHVIETAQTTDIQVRQRLASTMLNLIQARRMWCGYEFEAIDDFFSFLTLFAPDAIRAPEYFIRHSEASRQIWLGGLALLSAYPEIRIDNVIDTLALAKARNQLLHATFAANPNRWVNHMIRTVRGGTIANEYVDVCAGKSFEQIRSEISQLSSKACRLSKSDLRLLNKERETIARAYGAMEINRLLPMTFRLPMEILIVFDVPHIVSNWSKLQALVPCGPLPIRVRKASQKELLSDPAILQTVIQHAVRAAAKVGLISTELSFQIILRDLQKCINDKEIPTGGLVFDADHAAALKRFDIIATADTNLFDSLGTMARSIEKRSQARLKRNVVTNANQLEKTLRDRLSA